MLRDAIKALEVRYADNLAALEAWGLATAPGPKGVTVYRPRTPTRQRQFLLAYVAKEGSLPESDRIAKPAFGDLEREARIVETAEQGRTQGRSQRKQANDQRMTVAGPLLDLLQVAAAVLLTRFDLKVTPELER